MSKQTMRKQLPFTGPWLLAPMDGITDPAFRRAVISLHRPEDLGGAFTEFVRVVDLPVPPRVLRRHLDLAGPIPVGLQLMGRDPAAMAETARRAEAAGAPLVDLNFGCPAKGALRGCAGSALLREPGTMEALVRACVDAVERVPVTAKIRAGFDDDSLVEDLARAAQEGGAALLTVHCRTRREGYQEEVDWSRIRRAVETVRIAVCGNGGVKGHRDLERMRRETGCAYVMVGRAAVADPWIFAGETAAPEQALRFIDGYVTALGQIPGWTSRGAAGRLKQLLRYWHAPGIPPEIRAEILRERDPGRFLDRLCAGILGAGLPQRTPPTPVGPDRPRATMCLPDPVFQQ
jgi:tRNA-dihydrouridine synthase C